MTFGGHLPEPATLAFTEMHLAKIGLDGDVEPQRSGQWRDGLHRSLERRSVDGVDRLGAESLADELGLELAEGRQRRVALTANEGKRGAFDECGRLTVADQNDLAGARRRLEEGLRIGLRFFGGRHRCWKVVARPRS